MLLLIGDLGFRQIEYTSVLGSLTISQSINKLISASATGVAVPGFV